MGTATSVYDLDAGFFLVVFGVGFAVSALATIATRARATRGPAGDTLLASSGLAQLLGRAGATGFAAVGWAVMVLVLLYSSPTLRAVGLLVVAAGTFGSTITYWLWQRRHRGDVAQVTVPAKGAWVLLVAAREDQRRKASGAPRGGRR